MNSRPLITEIHVWLGTTKDGEGILSAEMSTRYGPRHLPLFSCNRMMAERLGEIARDIKVLTDGTGGELTAVEMVTFQRVP